MKALHLSSQFLFKKTFFHKEKKIKKENILKFIVCRPTWTGYYNW